MSKQATALFHGLDAVAAREPTRPCLRFADETLTYGDVASQSIELARGLVARGLGGGHRIGVLSPNHPMGVVSAIAILRAGGTWLPLNPRDSINQISSVLTRLRGEILIFHSTFADAVAELRATTQTLGFVCLDTALPDHVDLLSWAATSIDETELPAPRATATAAIFATGGTTGVPRGVRFSFRTLGMILHSLGHHIGHDEPIYLAAMPLTHAAGRVCLGVVEAGGTTVVLPGFDAGDVLRAIDRDRITFLTLAPTMLTSLLNHPDVGVHDYSSLRRLIVGAAPVPVELSKRAIAAFGPVVLQGYGQTEAPLYIATKRPGDDVVDGVLQNDHRLRSCGRASDFSELRIIDRRGAPRPTGEIGEIAVRGAFVMDGYDDDPEATAATRTTDGFHRTGDLGFLDRDGFLTVTGRAKDMIISGGFNVYPAQVEDVLAGFPGVREVAVIGLPDDRWGEVVAAIIQPHAGETVDEKALMQFARERLGGVNTPKRLWIMADLPRNANGKILKRSLMTRLAAGERPLGENS